MKIRLVCLPGEVDQAVAALRTAFDVISVSLPYPMRGDDRRVRVYVDAQVRTEVAR